MKSISIELTVQQTQKAMAEAHRRHLQSKQLKQKPRGGGPAQDQKGLEIDIAGALGEMAAASYLGLEEFVFTFNKNWGVYDLPPNIDVKTALGHSRRLHIFLNEKPEKLFVHATYKYEKLQLHGWAYGGQVMKPEYIDNPRQRGDSYFVPSHALNPITDLKAILHDLGYSK